MSGVFRWLVNTCFKWPQGMNKSNLACECQDWHLHLWNPLDPEGTQKHVPWRCGSWRHAGECRQWKGAQDFVRVSHALKRRSDWTAIVLTFRQGDWLIKNKLYRAGVSMWAKLRKRLVREFGRMEYVQTWERHAKGGPHVNCAVANEKVFDSARYNPAEFHDSWLKPHALACGFGYKCWAHSMYDAAGLAAYYVKLASELTGSGIKNQIPTDAPPHFRRLRASRGTLPPIERSDLTGRLVQCPVSQWARNTLEKL